MPNFQPPSYVSQAADTYIASGTWQVHATIGLALAAGEWRRELEAGIHGKLPPESRPVQIVLHYLLQSTRDKSLASRYLAISQLAELAEAQNLTLDGIRSQGTLFAILPVIRRAKSRGIAISLSDVLQDAARMTIAEFRKKWTIASRLPRPFDLGTVQAWIAATTNRDILKVFRDLIDERLEELRVVVSSQPCTLVAKGI